MDNDHTIWDSLAITEYVAESYPQVWAEDKTARAWSRSACAEMHSGFHVLREICDFRPLDRITLADIPDELVHELARLDALWQEGLNRFAGNFLAGEQFTAVDAFLCLSHYALKPTACIAISAKNLWLTNAVY